jgi:2-oxoisovalerate dehydrogenase E2 component (dihydrolipoyl transacylase)
VSRHSTPGEHLNRRLQKTVHLGVAVDTEHGLFVPVLRDIGNRSAEDLREGLNRLRSDVKARTIPPSELQGASITLSNFGTLGGRYATPIVVPPQVAIIGAGAIRREPVMVGNQVKGHRMLPLSITFDHRAATGGEAARFLQAMIASLSRETD